MLYLMKIKQMKQYYIHTILLTRLLLPCKKLHSAIKLGDVQRVVLTVKHMLPYFKANKSYKYALACLELIAQLQLFLSPRQCLAITQGRFVNLRGARNSRQIYVQSTPTHRGECAQQALDRVSKLQTLTKKILDNFQTNFGGKDAHVGCHNLNAEKYENDMTMLYTHLEPYKLYVARERVMRSSSLNYACKDPVKQCRHLFTSRLDCETNE